METDRFSSQMLADTLESFDYTPVLFNEGIDLTLQLIDADPYMVIVNRRLFKTYRDVFINRDARNSRNFNSCLIITSGDLVDPEEIHLLEADFFLFKPYDMEVLSNLLAKIEALIFKEVTGMVLTGKKSQLRRQKNT